MGEDVFEVHLKNSRMVRLADLADSMNALAEMYSSFCGRTDPGHGAELYVKEVRKGSVIIDLASTAGALMPIVENAGSIIQFAAFFKSVVDCLSKPVSVESLPDGADAKTLRNVGRVLNPCVKDADGSVAFSVIGDNNKVSVYVDRTSAECSGISNRAVNVSERMMMPGRALLEKEILYLNQVRNDGKSGNPGDRGIVNSVSKSPKKLISLDDSFKKDVLDSRENFFDYGYIVDIEVERAGDRVVAYRILKYHEKFLIEDDE